MVYRQKVCKWAKMSNSPTHVRVERYNKQKNDEFTLAVFHFLVKLYVVENEVFTRVGAVGFYRYVIQS